MAGHADLFDKYIAAYLSGRITLAEIRPRVMDIMGKNKDITLFHRLPGEVREKILGECRGLADGEIDAIRIIFGGTVAITDMDEYRKAWAAHEEDYRCAVRMVRDLAATL